MIRFVALINDECLNYKSLENIRKVLEKKSIIIRKKINRHVQLLQLTQRDGIKFLMRLLVWKVVMIHKITISQNKYI